MVVAGGGGSGKDKANGKQTHIEKGNGNTYTRSINVKKDIQYGHIYSVVMPVS